MSSLSNQEQEALHYYCTIADFMALAEDEGLYQVLKTLLDELDMSKAMPHNINDLKRCYDLLQYLQNSVVNAIFDTVYEEYNE